MPIFAYIAKSSTGESVKGTVDAPDKRAAVVQIERRGCVPVSIHEGVAPSAQETKDQAKQAKPEKRKLVISRTPRQPRMGLRDVLLFSRELTDLLSSGMTLGNALNTLARRKTKKVQDQIIVNLRDEIIKGTSMSDALTKWPKSFSNLYISMVRAGEASGTLAETLERLCKHYERVQEAREKVTAALIYPSIVMLIGFGTMIFTMIFVVPRFSSIFAELGSTLPLSTRILIDGSAFMVKYGWVLLLLAIFGVYMFRRWLNTVPGREHWDRFQLKMPLVKLIVASNAYAQFARTLGALLSNGVPVLQALSIVEHTVGNTIIAKEIREARERVTDGSSISGPLAAGNVFPPLLTDMLAVGEQTGDMSGALTHIAKRYDNELDRNVKVFTTVLEPLMIVVMAALVGFVAVSMLLAVFDMTSGLNIK